jgi:hypothetical protein
MGPEGLELPLKVSEKVDDSPRGGAKCGAVGGRSHRQSHQGESHEHPSALPVDSTLVAIIDAWPTLPEALRQGIAAMVEAAKPGG